MIVYPRMYRISYFPFEPRRSAVGVEDSRGSRKGVGQEYYGVREYQSGDSLRNVHWKSSARLGELIVREYAREYRPTAGLVVYLLEPSTGDDDTNSLEDGLRCASTILNYYQAMGCMPRLALPVEGSLDVLHEASFRENLKALALYQAPGKASPEDSGELAEALSLARLAVSPDAALSLVTNVLIELGFANGAIGVLALVVFFGEWGVAAEAVLMLAYALYLGLAFFIFSAHARQKGLDSGKIVSLCMWIVQVGFMFYFAIAASIAESLPPF